MLEMHELALARQNLARQLCFRPVFSSIELYQTGFYALEPRLNISMRIQCNIAASQAPRKFHSRAVWFFMCRMFFFMLHETFLFHETNISLVHRGATQ